ncbi:MAG: aldo/keto reductase [Cyanobacteriota bacterium]
MPSPQPSRLGFGTSGIMGAALTSRGRLRLLETAFDAGIRHFDTAPLYGLGLAEEVLGRFARGRRQQITLTTKFGLVPPAIPAPLRPVVPVARILHRRLGGRWRAALRALAIGRPLPTPSAAASAAPGVASPPRLGDRAMAAPAAAPYNLAALRASLDTSLRKLGTDHIDFFLLHECQPGQLTEEGITLLEGLVAEGKIGRWGLGSGRTSSRVILERWPDRNALVQIPDHLLRRDTSWFARHGASPLFTHSVLQGPLRDPACQGLLPILLRGWAERTGQDPSKPGLLGELLLLGGLLNNAEGCVLFSSGQSARIAAQGRLARQLPSLGPPLAKLLAELPLAGAEGEPCL